MGDFRAYLVPRDKDEAEKIIGNVAKDGSVDYLLSPLTMTGNGIVFPYTPIISGAGGKASYELKSFTHSIYPSPIYQYSSVNNIVLSADFTAQTRDDARYILAVIRFCSITTKMSFGKYTSSTFGRGTPPPILKFRYLGRHMYDDVPVVMESFNYELPKTVDYVGVNVKARTENNVVDEVTYVPTKLTLMLTLIPFYNPYSISNTFSMDDFINGRLTDGTGGYM
jgi:hypothetical protein